MNKLILKSIIATFFLLGFTSCEKPPGPGGKATIKGKVFVNDFDNNQYIAYGKGYQAGIRVYICYGDDKIIGNDTRTGLDGEFEFRHLNKGKYTVFVNSLDTSQKNKGNDRELPILRTVKIKSATEEVTLEEFKINQ
jgi:hypothetical protein